MRERDREIAVYVAEEDTATLQLSSAVPAQTGRTFTQAIASAAIIRGLTFEVNSSMPLLFTLVSLHVHVVY